MRDDEIPELIQRAGKHAVAVYRAFLDDPKWSPTTHRLYTARAKRFFEWAESRGLSLAHIAASDIAVYSAEIGAAKASGHLTPMRGLFEQWVQLGLLASSPCSVRVRHAVSSVSIPWIIRVAGADAVRAYCEFLDDPNLNAGVRAYRDHIGHFSRWAEGSELDLKKVTADDAARYASEIKARLSDRRASARLAALTGLFRHLAASGVIAANPFEKQVRKRPN
jgi:site-specific recombinase XerD